MQSTAILPDINAYFHKARCFWYLNSYAKLVDVVADGDGDREIPERVIKLVSYLPLWGSIRYNTKNNALLDLTSWRGVVSDVVSTD